MEGTLSLGESQKVRPISFSSLSATVRIPLAQGSLAITSLAGTLPKSQGGTGATDTAGLVTILNAAGLTLTSSLADGATTSVASIRAGTTKANVGLTNVEDKDAPDQVTEAFSESKKVQERNILHNKSKWWKLIKTS